MLAKGWLLGAQFEALLKDDLYLSLSRHANTLALMLRDGLAAQGWRLHGRSPSNQQFVWLPTAVVNKLREHCAFGTLEHGEGECMVRFCTSWATKEEDVRAAGCAVAPAGVSVYSVMVSSRRVQHAVFCKLAVIQRDAGQRSGRRYRKLRQQIIHCAGQLRIARQRDVRHPLAVIHRHPRLQPLCQLCNKGR